MTKPLLSLLSIRDDSLRAFLPGRLWIRGASNALRLVWKIRTPTWRLRLSESLIRMHTVDQVQGNEPRRISGFSFLDRDRIGTGWGPDRVRIEILPSIERKRGKKWERDEIIEETRLASIIKMARKTPKVRASKGKRWAKGSSSSCNPETKKFRQAARGRLPSVPTGVECTYLLTKAMLEFDEEKSVSAMEQRYLLSFAIVRFVNLVTSLYQKHEKHAIHRVGETIGIPYWLVELRHEVSHSRLPGLEVLKMAVEFCLQWLRVVYWESESKFLAELLQENPTGNYLKSEELVDERPAVAIRVYKENRIRFLKTLTSTSDGHMNMQRLKRKKQGKGLLPSGALELATLRSFISTRPALVADALVAEGNLLPLKNAYPCVREYLKQDGTSVQPDWISLWEPLISIFLEEGKANVLLESLLSEHMVRNSLQAQICTNWAIWILGKLEEKANDSPPKKCQKIEGHHGFSLYVWNGLLRMASHIPNLSTSTLISKLSRATDLPKEKVRFLEEVINLYTRATSKDETSFSDTCAMGATSVEGVLGAWELCSGEGDWSSCPIGLLPHQTYNHLEMSKLSE
ncbi:unnamed protein product [Darwinula stevensoni]|uniref:Ribosomal biogenesis protein LAS1L n=1 Tax=Darwinula stevensoni TaxID=69355 RepID=A0A7R8ZXT8_9CRUS|nr:unnamed protein product [Darwinula stevensoni]CAG0879073.1 unnamed protein product [Darwinula stevensoni]